MRIVPGPDALAGAAIWQERQGPLAPPWHHSTARQASTAQCQTWPSSVAVQRPSARDHSYPVLSSEPFAREPSGRVARARTRGGAQANLQALMAAP